MLTKRDLSKLKKELPGWLELLKNDFPELSERRIISYMKLERGKRTPVAIEVIKKAIQHRNEKRTELKELSKSINN